MLQMNWRITENSGKNWENKEFFWLPITGQNRIPVHSSNLAKRYQLDYYVKRNLKLNKSVSKSEADKVKSKG